MFTRSSPSGFSRAYPYLYQIYQWVSVSCGFNSTNAAVESGQIESWLPNRKGVVCMHVLMIVLYLACLYTSKCTPRAREMYERDQWLSLRGWSYFQKLARLAKTAKNCRILTMSNTNKICIKLLNGTINCLKLIINKCLKKLGILERPILDP